MDEFNKVIGLIDNQLESIKNEKDSSYFRYTTISVFGERGTGKTSFLYSIIDEVNNKYEDVEVLDIIDPTLIEEKEHIFLLVISLINDAVDKKLKGKECALNSQSYRQRKEWNDYLKKLAKGLPTLDKVGFDHKTQQWQSHEFIMESGLSSVHSAFNLAQDFHCLVEKALKILGKKAFLLVLDDIDVDMHKGWDVLEMLRKYVNTQCIITILSGNLNLYSLNVRKHQWSQLKDNREFEEKGYDKIVNELEGQYLLKILKPEYRIHLYSVLELIEVLNHQYELEGFDKPTVEIKEAYRRVLYNLGIRNANQVEVFLNYLLSLSIRTQIQFLSKNRPSKDNSFGLGSVESFISRLYAANIDVAIAVNNVKLLNLCIQKYIKNLPFTPDLYLLTPNNASEDVNACMMAFTILFSKQVKKNPFLIFDYLIRLGYMRNVILTLNSYQTDDFYDRVGLNQLMSLKNNVGFSLAYHFIVPALSKASIFLLGFADKDRQNEKEKKGRIDYEVESHANFAQTILSYLPLSVLKYSERNDTKVVYSFYSLLAVIGEVLKIPKNDAQKELLKAVLINLQVPRSYPMWSREGLHEHGSVEEDIFDMNLNEDRINLQKEDDNSFDELVEVILKWIDEFHESIPPYLLGKIATRTFYAILKIDGEYLGEQMHRCVVAFLNACLVEELTEYYEKKEDKESISGLNISNAITKDDVLENNIKFVNKNDAMDVIKMTRWMAKCPLLWCFMSNDIFQIHYSESMKVYTILSNVIIKGKSVKKPDLPTFKSGRNEIIETIRYLKEKGYNINRIMNQKRAIPDIIAEIDGLGLFSKKPTKPQISTFRKNYKDLHLNENTEPVEYGPSDREPENDDFKILTDPIVDPIE